jgi:hypothetical protein
VAVPFSLTFWDKLSIISFILLFPFCWIFNSEAVSLLCLFFLYSLSSSFLFRFFLFLSFFFCFVLVCFPSVFVPLSRKNQYKKTGWLARWNWSRKSWMKEKCRR